MFEDSVKDPLQKGRVVGLLKNLYGQDEDRLRKAGFNIGLGERWFKRGPRSPHLNFYCADSVDDRDRQDDEQRLSEFLHLLTGGQGPLLVLSGHTHKVHEFRLERAASGHSHHFHFFMDHYSGRYFRRTQNRAHLLFRYGFLKSKSPLLLTSSSLKNRQPEYREIMVRGQSLASLEMKPLSMDSFKPAADFSPGCFLIALRAHNGQYVCAEDGGRKALMANRTQAKAWETFELIKLEHDRVALKACNGKFVRAIGGGGGQLKADRQWIKDHETFQLFRKGEQAIALRAHNGQFVCAEGGGGRELVANRRAPREWETFRIVGEMDGF